MIKEMVMRIIQEQELIIGSVAWTEAAKIEGLQVDVRNKAVTIETETKQVIEHLVEQYARLFGEASLEVCRDAVRPLLPDLAEGDVPDILR